MMPIKKNSVKALSVVVAITTLLLIYNKSINTEFDQAERISRWKTVFNEIKYDFDLINTNENGIIHDEEIAESVFLTDFKSRIYPYLNIEEYETYDKIRYKYKKLNGKPVKKNYQFFFDDLVRVKTGEIISVKENTNYNGNNKIPAFYMLIDINGSKKPNTIGKDIYFINIYNDHITPLGYGAERAAMKTNCSPVGSGIYCGEYYLLGGKFTI